MAEDKQIGTISNYFDHVKVAAIKLTAPLKVGDKIEIKGGEVDIEQTVKSMQLHHDKIDSAKKGDEIGKIRNTQCNIIRRGLECYQSPLDIPTFTEYWEGH